MSEANTRRGSTLRRTRDPLVDPRIHGVKGFGAHAGILGGVDPAAEFEHPTVEFVEKLVDPRLVREVHATFQPAIGKLSGARLPGPKNLNTFRAE